MPMSLDSALLQGLFLLPCHQLSIQPGGRAHPPLKHIFRPWIEVGLSGPTDSTQGKLRQGWE